MISDRCFLLYLTPYFQDIYAPRTLNGTDSL